jgi:hypothetical protein
MILNADVFFSIPTNVLALTDNICKLKYGGKVSWDKYLERFSTFKLDRLNSKSGKKYIPVYRIEYRDVAVWTEVGFLDKEIEREEGWFTLEIGLKFSFDVITNMYLKYPILICNKPIKKEYLIISETLLKKYSLPIERSLFDSLKINTLIELINADLREDVEKVMKHLDLDSYKKLLKYSPELKNYGNTIEEIIEKSVDKYIEDMYNLNYNLKRRYPIYDVWNYYNNYSKYEPISII